VLGPRVSAINLSAQRVVGGNTVTGTITIDRRASGVVDVSIAASNNTASVSTVPSGQTLGAFQITTTAVTTEATVTISATLNGVTKTATLTVTPP
jgi:hypothetical protein